MSACESVRVQVHCVEGLTEKMEAVHDRITQRAYEHWLNRRARGRTIVEFWSEAEQELFLNPKTEVREWGHGIIVNIVCGNIDPSTIRLFMSTTEILLLAPLNKPEVDRWVFRYLQFPKSLDNGDVSAEFENGTLRIAATLLNAPDDEKVRFRVA